MKSRNIATRGTVMLALVGCLVGPGALQAQTMDQYYAVPPFVSDQVAPNILLLLDNSGSMSDLACDRDGDGDCVTVATDLVFTGTTSYSGYFDPLSCYTYNTTDTRFVAGTVKALLVTPCLTTEWDGNFLNYATFRRFDALKKSMTETSYTIDAESLAAELERFRQALDVLPPSARTGRRPPKRTEARHV